MAIRVANAAGFWGDDVDATRRIVRSTNVHYLTLEYLAELTMSILTHLKSKDPAAGYAIDVLFAVQDVIPVMEQQPQLRIVTNAGGTNPRSCATAVSRLLVDAGRGDDRIGVVLGDDLLPRLTELANAGHDFAHIDTSEPLGELLPKVACANAYLGAAPIVEALSQGARFVITGRVADASLTVAPAVHEYGWSWDDWNRLAAATVAGHLIECGAQVTGGYSDRDRSTDFVEIGYPIAELAGDGTAVITKPDNSGGVVDRRSVVEQLVYEIGDPRNYLTPDVVADFTSVAIADMGDDRVRVTGARGKSAPDSLKVSLAYRAGYMANAQLLVAGRDAVERGQRVGELVFARLARAGFTFQQTLVECLGAGAGAPRTAPERRDASEIVVRISVRDTRRGHVERFTREIAPLITNGPSGLAGYASGRTAVRPVLAYWPTTIHRSAVRSSVEVRTALEWTERKDTA